MVKYYFQFGCGNNLYRLTSTFNGRRICYIIDIRKIQIAWVETIKNRDILSIIREVSETLALNSKPEQLLGTTLDTLSGIFKADCGWVQLANTGTGNLPLIACLGFTPEMKDAMNLLHRDHHFSREIIGLGHKIIIPSLNRDGKYNIPIFEESGFKSLLAVPIMTYRIHGILGMAFRSKMKFSDDFLQLLDVITNLIGMSLQKSMMNKPLIQERPAEPASSDITIPDNVKADIASITSSLDKYLKTTPKIKADKHEDSQFQDHDRSMRLFSESHQ